MKPEKTGTEILYRAKSKKTNEFVFGIPLHDGSENFNFIRYKAMWVLNSDGYWKIEQIYPETLSQYIGFKDKNQKKIFVGDTLKSGTATVVVDFVEGVLELRRLDIVYSHGLRLLKQAVWEIIDTI